MAIVEGSLLRLDIGVPDDLGIARELGLAVADLRDRRLLRAIALVVGLAFVWALFAPIDRIVRAEGRVIAAGRAQIIQHLEGGIVQEILVREGQSVQSGQVLMRLASLQANAEVRAEVAVIKVPEWNRYANSFGHIFAGGYAAGYYSYKWAEVLSADAFAAFEEAGIYDRGTAQRFVDNILARGGSRDALDAFVAFRGRKSDIKPLLRQHGIASQ
mgnify:CR=1 FL=1